MNPYLRMFRMGNAVMGCVGAVVAAYIAVGFNILDYGYQLAVLVAVVFLFIAGGNTLNDGIDEEIDKVSHPDRPVPRGEVTAENARKAGILLLLLSVMISIASLDVVTIAIVFVAVILMIAYETRLKQVGFAGNVTIAVLTGLVFVLGSAVVGDWTANISIAVMVAAVSVGREIAKDIEDMEGDVGRRTLPMRIGTRNAAVVSAVFTIIGVCMSVLPVVGNTVSVLYYVVILADASFIIAAYKVFSDPHGSSKMSKIGMLFGLLAFILGKIPV